MLLELPRRLFTPAMAAQIFAAREPEPVGGAPPLLVIALGTNVGGGFFVRLRHRLQGLVAVLTHFLDALELVVDVGLCGDSRDAVVLMTALHRGTIQGVCRVAGTVDGRLGCARGTRSGFVTRFRHG